MWIPRVLKSLVPRNEFLYKACKRYVDRYNGDNNVNIETNGELYFLRKYLIGSKIVFDVGANVGEWASWALRINPTLAIHCFEPSSETFEILKRNMSSYNVICNNFGLGATSSEMTLYIIEKITKMNSLYRREGLEYLGIQQAVKKERIRIDTISKYCTRYGLKEIDFLKIDVEGHELEVLKGMTELLRHKRVGVIQFEYGGAYIDARIFLKDIWGFVLSVNSDYSFFKLYPSEIRKVSRYSQVFENFQYQNWAIIRNPRI